MHPRADELIRRLGLLPHPEGGLYRRTWRSAVAVQPNDARGPRHALTAIFYLLVDRGISRWHRVASDEAWHWCEGAELELHTAAAGGGLIATHILGPLSEHASPQHVVAAGHWQAARCTGEYTLVGCCVAPGFLFDDFTLLAGLAPEKRPALSPRSVFDRFL